MTSGRGKRHIYGFDLIYGLRSYKDVLKEKLIYSFLEIIQTRTILFWIDKVKYGEASLNIMLTLINYSRAVILF